MVHFVWQRPYPYDKPSDIRRVPPAALLAHSDVTRYLETLDALAMVPAEWRDHAARRVHADADEHLGTLR